MSSFAKYAAAARSMLTLVLDTGVTVSVLGEGAFKGGSKKLYPAMALRIISGDILVATPHSQGTFSERRIGGIYPSLKAKTKWMTLGQQIARDPRITEEGDRQLIVDAINAYYGTQLVLGQ